MGVPTAPPPATKHGRQLLPGDIRVISWGYTTNNIPTTCSGYIIGLVYGNAGILIEFLDIGVNRLPQNMIIAYNTNLC
jgi:hypothetical protein